MWLLAHRQKRAYLLVEMHGGLRMHIFSRYHLYRNTVSALKTESQAGLLGTEKIYILLNYADMKLKHFNVIIPEAHHHSKSQNDSVGQWTRP